MLLTFFAADQMLLQLSKRSSSHKSTFVWISVTTGWIIKTSWTTKHWSWCRYTFQWANFTNVYIEIHIIMSYFNRDTKQSSATWQNAENP